MPVAAQVFQQVKRALVDLPVTVLVFLSRAAVAQLVAEYRAELASAMRRGVHAQRPASLATQTDDLAENIVALVIAAFALARVDSTQARHNLTLALRLAHD